MIINPEAGKISRIPQDFASWMVNVCWKYLPLPALLAFPFRRPYLELTHCIFYTPVCYTPEKPGCHSAFRVSTCSYKSLSSYKNSALT